MILCLDQLLHIDTAISNEINIGASGNINVNFTTFFRLNHVSTRTWNYNTSGCSAITIPSNNILNVARVSVRIETNKKKPFIVAHE